MEYTRNSDLSYYETHRHEANCGSYALRLNEWYDLDYYFEDVTGYYIDEWVNEKSEEGYDDYEISTMYGDILVEGILEEFDGELEKCDGRPPETDDVELVAFSTFCYSSDSLKSVDYDYHFKVLRDGKWMEKCGSGPVEECTENGWGDYIGDVTYFYHKIGGNDGSIY